MKTGDSALGAGGDTGDAIASSSNDLGNI